MFPQSRFSQNDPQISVFLLLFFFHFYFQRANFDKPTLTAIKQFLDIVLYRKNFNKREIDNKTEKKIIHLIEKEWEGP